MADEIVVRNKTSLTKRLWSMKADEECCDATLVINGKSVAVHSAVLASISEYFKHVFEKLPEKVVVFKNVDSEAMELLIKYSYTGMIKITRKNANSIFTMASVLSIPTITKHQAINVYKNLYDIEKCVSKWIIDASGNLENLYTTEDCFPENTLIVFGSHVGQVLEKHIPMEIFDAVKQEWIEIDRRFSLEQLTSTPLLYKEKLLMIGGVSSNEELVNTIDSYDLKSGKFEIFPPMKHRRIDCLAVVHEDCIFVISGGIVSIVKEIEKWNPTTNSWTDIDPLTIARAGCGVKVFENKIYIVGGIGENMEFLDSTEYFDPSNNQRKICKSMNEKRAYFGICVVNGYLYAVGGHNGYGKTFTAEKYDPKIDKWIMFKSPEKLGDFNTAGNLNGKFVISFMDSVQIYDDAKDEWKSLPNLKNSRIKSNLVEVPWMLAKQIISRNIPK